MSVIIHICHTCGGGTQKYVDDLITLYPEYEHIIVNDNPFIINDVSKIKLLHIHGTFYASNIEWDILRIIDLFKQHDVAIYLTIHDYQWLFDNLPHYTYDKHDDFVKSYEKNKENTCALFDKVDKIFIPTETVYTFYRSIMKSIDWRWDGKIYIVPHPDVPIRNEQLYIPLIDNNANNRNNNRNNIINIAYIGVFNEYKGALLFLNLVHNLREYSYNGTTYIIHYHIFGKHTPSEHDEPLRSFVHFHGSYKHNELIEKLYENNIHIQTALSVYQETYCYALTNMINSGIPIVYYNHGAFKSRLNSSVECMFPFDNVSELIMTVKESMNYVIENQGKKDITKMGDKVLLNDDYKRLYV